MLASKIYLLISSPIGLLRLSTTHTAVTQAAIYREPEWDVVWWAEHKNSDDQVHHLEDRQQPASVYFFTNPHQSSLSSEYFSKYFSLIVKKIFTPMFSVCSLRRLPSPPPRWSSPPIITNSSEFDLRITLTPHALFEYIRWCAARAYKTKHSLCDSKPTDFWPIDLWT